MGFSITRSSSCADESSHTHTQCLPHEQLHPPRRRLELHICDPLPPPHPLPLRLPPHPPPHHNHCRRHLWLRRRLPGLRPWCQEVLWCTHGGHRADGNLQGSVSVLIFTQPSNFLEDDGEMILKLAGGLCIAIFCLEWVVLTLAFFLSYYAYM